MSPQALILSWRWQLTWAVLGLLMFALAGRLVALHVWLAPEWRQESWDVRHTLRTVEARRGQIIDRHGVLLATTQATRKVGIDPHVVTPQDRERFPELAARLGLPLQAIEDAAAARHFLDAEGRPRLDKPRRWVPLAEVGEGAYEEIEALGLDSVYANRHYQRYYPGGTLAAHVIGFVNREDRAVQGVERWLDPYLRGARGWQILAKDGRRRDLAAFRERSVDARHGHTLRLTLDARVQHAAEALLDEIVATYSPASATVIVSEAMTGELLALGNRPTFDANRFFTAPEASLRNRAVTDLFEPGSTFKIIPLAAVLEGALLNPESLIDCASETLWHRGGERRLPADHKELGVVPLHRAVAQSSNRGAAQMAALLGEEGLHAWAERFGFGQHTGWPLEGEVPGILHDVEDWDALTLTRMPAGYALAATPLQVHQAMLTVASGGRAIEPRLLDAVLDPAGRPIAAFPASEGHAVLSPEVARTVAALLSGVAAPGGTGFRAELPGFAIAGKTGTARKIVDGRYSNRHHVASFSGFFPADQPRFVVTVVIDEAELPGTAYGGVVAAPAFREMAASLVQLYALEARPVLAPYAALP